MALGWLRRWYGWQQPEGARALAEPPWPQIFNSYSFTSPGSPQEDIDPSFVGFARASIYSPIVYACMEARKSLFSEARFQFRQLRSGRPGQLFGSSELSILENPWPNGTTGDLLARAIQDVDISGNFYCRRAGDRLQVMRPDWVTIVLGSMEDPEFAGWALDAEVIGYLYHPGGKSSRADPVAIPVEEVCHFAPTPDPVARFRGISWLNSLLSELQADRAMTQHKLQFFEHGATPNLAVMLDVSDPDRYEKWSEKIRARFGGVANAYETMVLGAGATVVPVGADIKQIDFAITQGGGETRIAAAARGPPVIVGFSEGLKAATYSNYGLAMRAWSDLSMRTLWRGISGALSSIVDVPAGSELWYDDRDIAALKDDIEKQSTTQNKEAQTIRTLLDAGYLPDTVVAAVTAGDWTQLEHSELFSVQLQPPGTAELAVNGNGEQPALPPGNRAVLDELERALGEGHGEHGDT